MDRRKRSYKLYEQAELAFADAMREAGPVAGDTLPRALDALFRAQRYAIATMLDESLKKKPRAKKPTATLPFTGPELHRRMQSHDDRACIWGPVDDGWWPRLNKQIGSLRELPTDAPERLADWLAHQKWAPAPFDHVVKNLKSWLPKALAWKKPARGSSGVRLQIGDGR